MPLYVAVWGDLEHKQTNKQKKTITLNFRDNKCGNGSWVNLIESEALNGFHGLEKRKKHVIVVFYETNSIKCLHNFIPAINTHLTNALNLKSYIFAYSTLAAILTTSTFGPDA